MAPDLDEMERFLSDFGLVVRARDNDVIYARGTDTSPYLHVTERGEAGFRAVGFEATSADDLRIAARTRSGKIDSIPDDLLHRLIAGMSSAGDMDDIDREIERYKKFEAGGLTELCLRLFDDPMDGLKMIGERVVPAFR